MYPSRQEKFLKKKQLEKFETFKLINKKVQRSVAVFGTTTFIGLYSSPVANILSAKRAVVEAATASDFLKNIIPAATTVAKGKDIYASVMIAQAALETGWGSSTLSQAPNYNLFGIKGNYNGESVNMQTLEDSGNQNYYSIQANFRKYPSYIESLEDYAQLLLNGISGSPQFYSGAWKSNTTSYKDATAYLTGRYATDSAYASKLNRIIEQYGLTQYDLEKSIEIAEEIIDQQSKDTPVTPVQPTTTDTSDANKVEPTNSYTIIAGDSLYGISRKTGVSISTLLAANNLQLSSIIYPGQVLVLSSSTENKTTNKQTETVSTQTETTNHQTYTIVAGDSLYGISRKTGVSIETLLAANNLQLSTVIHPGQVLQLTKTSQSAVVKTESEKTQESSETTKEQKVADNGTYTIVAGDSLYGISRKTGVAVSTLLTANHLQLTSVIHPGQVLTLTTSGSTTTKSVDTQTATQKASQTVEETATTTGTYTIKAGDTLYHIAHANGISLASLLSWNHLEVTSVIHPGQTLIVSQEAQTTTQTEQAQTTTVKTYTVKAGDGLWRIAVNHGLNLDTLKAINHLTSNMIYPGQVLTVAQ